MAIDSFADVFELDTNNRLCKFINFFNSLRLPINEMPENEVFLIWKGYLVKIAEAQIAHLYAQLDPAGFKIKRNIKDVVQTTEYFILSKNIYDTILVIPNTDCFSKLPYLELESVTTEFMTMVKGIKTTRELLRILHDIIEGQLNCRKEIKLTDAVQLFKKAFGYEREPTVSEENDLQNLLANSTIEHFEIEQISDKVLYNVKEKILVNYYSRGKLTKVQSEALYNAMCDLIFDWIKTGGNNHSFYEYYVKYSKIDSEIYHELIRDKIEYLVKTSKKDFLLYLFSKE